MGLELIGVVLVMIAIIYSFYRKRDTVAFCLVITLVSMLYLLGYF